MKNINFISYDKIKNKKFVIPFIKVRWCEVSAISINLRQPSVVINLAIIHVIFFKGIVGTL